MISEDKRHRHRKRLLGANRKPDGDECEAEPTAKRAEDHERLSSEAIDQKCHDRAPEHQGDEVDTRKYQRQSCAEAERIDENDGKVVNHLQIRQYKSCLHAHAWTLHQLSTTPHETEPPSIDETYHVDAAHLLEDRSACA